MENKLEKNVQEKVISKIEEINILVNKFIDSDHIEKDKISLFAGLPGAALFLYEYSQYKPEKTDACYEKIGTIIENAFDYIGDIPNAMATYCSGMAGTLWLIEYMRKKNVIELDADYLSPQMMDYLNKWSQMETLDRKNCDLLHGGFGFLAFLLECDSLPNKEQLIEEQLQALDKIAIETPNGRNWKINDSFFGGARELKITVDSDTSINLGLAHGISAILILLAKTNLQGYFKKETEENIHQGLKLIKSLKITNQGSNYLYPTTVLNGIPSGGSRLAWCYGVFCVANAYWMCWKATGKEEYKSEALNIMDFSEKIPVNDESTRDAGICHGTSGIAQIFRRFYQETNNSSYANTSNKWIAATLEMATYKDGYAGYKAFRPQEDGGPTLDYGFLEGVTGIGLALLSSLSSKPTDWDRVLQIS